MNKVVVHLLVLVSLLLGLVAPASADVILSELCDPRLEYLSDRFIEIANTGSTAVDLTGWSIVALGNGAPIFTWNLSGTIQAGEALVAGDQTTAVNFQMDFPDEAWSTSNSTWNGNINDGAELYNGGTLIDRVQAGGTTFENSDYTRNADVTTPTTSYDPAEWTRVFVDLPTEGTPGSHNGSTPMVGPTIADVTLVPGSPQPADPVDVTATVTDAVANITAVALEWGTTAGVLSNSIPMAIQSGDTWATTTPIPGQTSGTTVYYSVTADNDLPATNATTEASFFVFLDVVAPTVTVLTAEGPNSVLVTFSEEVEAISAGTMANYSVSGATVTAAELLTGGVSVRLTVTTLVTGSHVLTVDGVEDLVGNVVVNLDVPFDYSGGNIPPGYYDGTAGLTGTALQSALHLIIDNHTVLSYTSLWTHFYSTDPKPNGKVWDMYSDVPGGTPPYEYTFGVDQTGDGATEGTGYNREHSWPSSWYGDISPMNTDLMVIYPVDVRCNSYRSNHPYGEVDVPTWTSLNGSKVGPCSYPGYTGTVFEPIDAYKGDFARTYFYMTARYYGEDAGWGGSGMVDGSQLLPWGEALLLEWNAADPVSQKELDRNEEVYAVQGNRNPFIDRPDFVNAVFQPELSAVPVAALPLRLHQNAPNPFNPVTTIRYELGAPGRVELRVYDMAGRLTRTLVQESQDAGLHDVLWRGRDESGRTAAAGVYFYRLRTGEGEETKRMTLVK